MNGFPENPISLVQHNVASLLINLQEAGLTGTLRVKNVETEKSIFLKAGCVMFAESNRFEDKIGQVLVRREEITPDQLDEALKESMAKKARLGAVLIQKGFVKPEQLIPAVRQQVEEIVYDLLKWEGGEGEFKKDELSQDQLINFNLLPAQLLLKGIRVAYTELKVKAVLGTLGDTPSVAPHADKKQILGQLDPDEKKVFGAVDGKKNLQQIQRASQVPPSIADRIMAAFAILGWLQAGKPSLLDLESAAPSPSAETPATPPPLESLVDMPAGTATAPDPGPPAMATPEPAPQAPVKEAPQKTSTQKAPATKKPGAAKKPGAGRGMIAASAKDRGGRWVWIFILLILLGVGGLCGLLYLQNRWAPDPKDIPGSFRSLVKALQGLTQEQSRR